MIKLKKWLMIRCSIKASGDQIFLVVIVTN